MPETDWRLEFTPAADKEIDKIGATGRVAILRYLRRRVLTSTQPWNLGKPLSGDLAGIWRYRIGEWRVLAKFDRGRLLVLVIRVGHRRDVYER